MQLKEKMSKRSLKLREKLKNRSCDVCTYPLYDNSIPVMELNELTSELHVQCTNCLSVYDKDIKIKHIGIALNVAKA
jgi:RNase P subunit RPR2